MTASFTPSTRRRTRQGALRLSETSPAFLEMQDMSKDNLLLDKQIFASATNAVTKFALVRAIQPNDSLEFIHSLTYKKKFKCSSTKVDVYAILANKKYYPVNLEFHRNKPSNVAITLDTGESPPKRRRNKTKEFKVPKEKLSFISLLSSDEEDNNNEATYEQMGTEANVIVPTDSSLVLLDKKLTTFTNPTMIAHPDPTPGYKVDDWVLTSLGPGYIEAFRVDRLPDSLDCLVHPILIYQVRLPFGILFASSKHVQSLEGSSYARETILSTPKGSLTRANILRLQPGVYLNDNFINFYLAHLEPSSKVHVFSSYFYTRIADLCSQGKKLPEFQSTLWNNLKGWIKHINIWEKDMLLIPIHHRLHWSVVAVCHPGLLLRPSENEEEQERILHLDSGRRFRLHTSSTIFRRIRMFLQVCLKQQHNMDVKSNKKSLPGGSPPAPAQANETDCGVYMLEWIERLIQSGLDVTQEFADARGDMPPFGKTAFPQSLMDRKRNDFQSLVYTLANENYNNE